MEDAFEEQLLLLVLLRRRRSRGGARNFPTGADSSNDGAQIWFSGYYKCQKSPKNCFSSSDGGLACSDGSGL